MISHYIKVAFRSLFKKKLFSLINLLSLSIGLACFSLLTLYIVNQRSYDSFHQKRKNIVRVCEWTDGIKGSEPGGDAWLYMPLGPAIKEAFPEVEDYIRLQTTFDGKPIRLRETSFRKPITFVDPSFFHIFSFRVLRGNAIDPLGDPGNVVLTRENAIRLFGTDDVIGQRIEIRVDSAYQPFVISAVTEDIPANSSLQYEFLLSFRYLESSPSGKGAVNNWHFNGFQNYLLLRNGSDIASLQNRMQTLRTRYFPDERAQLKEAGVWDGKSPFPITFRLQPLTDIHANPKITAGYTNPIDLTHLLLLTAIAAAVLLIACINFSTIAIARSAGRTKEIGIRKTIGSDSHHIAWQFLTESILLTCIAGLLGLLFTWLLLPYFNDLTDSHLRLSFTHYPQLGWILITTVVISGFLAGSYPAFILSRLRPIQVFRQKLKLGASGAFMRPMIVFQYVISASLILSTIFILQQLAFMKNHNPGFDKDNVLVINAEGADAARIYPLFRTAAARIPTVMSIAAADKNFGEGYNTSGFEYEGKPIQAYRVTVDAAFPALMGMRLVAGRNYDPDLATDTVNTVLINQSLVRDLHTTDEKVLNLRFNGFARDPHHDPVVIGVVKDFNFLPLRQSIPGLVISQSARLNPSYFFIRVSPGRPGPIIAQLRSVWNRVASGEPFQYSFLDDQLDKRYQEESRLTGIFGWAGSISIFLACLGLFGLAWINTARRIKEINIRKVFGASAAAILRLLSRDFLLLVLVALVIATPLTWYYLSKWLQNYPYRIAIDPAIFLIAGIAILLLTFFVIAAVAISAIRSNPTNALRNE